MSRVYFRRKKGDKTSRKEAPKHGTWHLDYRDAGGVRIQPRTDARTKAEAEEKLREALQDVDDIRNSRAPRSRKAIRLEDAIREFLAARAGTASYEHIELTCRLHIGPALGRKFLSEVTVADVERFGNDLQQGARGRRPLAASTAAVVITRLNTIFEWARKSRRFFNESPVRAAAKPRPVVRRPRRLRSSDLERMLSFAGPWADLFWFAACTGLREGEVVALRWGHVILDGAPTLHVQHSNSSDTTKGKRDRFVPLPATVADMLRERKASAVSDFVWPGKDGGRQRGADVLYNLVLRAALTRAGLSKGWRYWCEPCGDETFSIWPRKRPCRNCGVVVRPRVVPGDLSFRHLRSTYATALKNPALAQRALGHRRLSTTMAHYFDTDEDDVREAAELMPFAQQRRDKGVTRPRRVVG
ncbi:site-specific integrase [Myxococcus sp. CA040A]|uniref:tyrosine-type recombinase/integrase n=1 Tax=Myxococcus sp. CA040A TaxID=2741738 RepID=UPI00157AF8D7|nr:tyrosine-type recombinase/integrase [Myxococcus sp. CA040A]